MILAFCRLFEAPYFNPLGGMKKLKTRVTVNFV